MTSKCHICSRHVSNPDPIVDWKIGPVLFCSRCCQPKVSGKGDPRTFTDLESTRVGVVHCSESHRHVISVTIARKNKPINIYVISSQYYAKVRQHRVDKWHSSTFINDIKSVYVKDRITLTLTSNEKKSLSSAIQVRFSLMYPTGVECMKVSAFVFTPSHISFRSSTELAPYPIRKPTVHGTKPQQLGCDVAFNASETALRSATVHASRFRHPHTLLSTLTARLYACQTRI
jgi:hypothetical protein